MSVGDIGQWRHTAGASPGTSWATLLLGAEDRNDNSNYSESSGVITLPSGRYLLTYQVAWVSSGDNGRCNTEIAIERNGTLYPGSMGSGYQRDTANDALWAAGSCIVTSSGSDTIEIVHRRDSDANVGSYDSGRSFLDIVQLPDDTALSIYSDLTDTSADDDTSLTAVPLDTTTLESDNSVISRSGGTVTLAANKAYLIVYGAGEYNSVGSRIARVSDLLINSVSIAGSSGFAYLRNTSDQYGCPNGTVIYETGGSSEDLQIRVCRGLTLSPGTAASGGTQTAGRRGLYILELPDSAEWYSSHDGTGGQVVANTTTVIPMTLFLNEDHTDTGLITKTSNTEIELQKDADMLLMAGMYIKRTTGSTRLTREGTFTINTVEQSHGTNGNYNRGDQSSADVYDSSHNPRGMFALSNGDDINVNISQSWDTGWNDGNGTAQTNTAIESGFFALNLDSLDSGGGTTHELIGSTDSVSLLSGSIDISTKHQLTGSTDSISLLSGSVLLDLSLSGNTDTVSLLSGSLGIKFPVSGSVDSISLLSGTLITSAKRVLSGSVDSISLLSGNIDITVSLQGSTDSISLLSGSLSTGGSIDLSGSVDSISLLSGLLNINRDLSGNTDSISLLSGDLNIKRGLSGNIDTVSFLSGNIDLNISLSGNIDSDSLLSGKIGITRDLSGSTDTISLLSGSIEIFTPGVSEVIYFDIDITEEISFSVDRISSLSFSIDRIELSFLIDKKEGISFDIDKTESLEFNITME